jgi:hypothetical protein
MKSFRKRLFLAFAALFFLIGLNLFTMYSTLQSTLPSERSLKKLATPAELQTWATNLLALYPTNTTLRFEEAGPYFPKQWDAHGPGRYRGVSVVSEDNPGHISLYWGGAFWGYGGISIGPTNYVCRRPYVHKWQDGIYFYYEND